MKKAHTTERQFASLALDPKILSGLHNAGYVHCTPIQELALPVLLSGQDIAGQAQTGTGKTLTFLTATFHHLLMRSKEDKERKSPHPRAIIMAPTRELAIQIHNDALFLSQSTGLSVQLAYGGDSFEAQKLKIQSGTDVLIGTVGRVIDFYKQEIFHLNAVEVVVLDEADRMFDLGFIKDIRYIFRRMSPAPQRLNMLFSATLSYRVQELAFEHMNAPQHVSVEPAQKTGHRIQEELFYPSNTHKMPLLQTLIEQDWPDRAILFANTKHRCDLIYRHLVADGHRVGLLTGDVAQKQREVILQRFTRGELDLLVATDVAARGLHIPQVTHVYNYDLPNDSEDYVHRIGRTGRAGECGHSISFACEEFAINLTAIEEYIEHCIPVSDYDAEALLTDWPKPQRPKRDGRMQDRTMRSRHNNRRHNHTTKNSSRH